MKNKIVLTLVLLLIVVIAYILTFNKISFFHGNIVVEKRNFHQSNYSDHKEKASNLIILVSNQSFEKEKVKIKGYIDNKELFNNKFKVGDQHLVSYYYSNLSIGEHLLNVESEDGAKILENISIGDAKTWVYLTYWYNPDDGPKIRVQVQNEPIGID